MQLSIFYGSIKKKFHSENNQSVEQLPQEHGRVLISGCFQEVAGQGSKQPNPGFLSHGWLDQMIFQGPFQPTLFHDFMKQAFNEFLNFSHVLYA